MVLNVQLNTSHLLHQYYEREISKSKHCTICRVQNQNILKIIDTIAFKTDPGEVTKLSWDNQNISLAQLCLQEHERMMQLS